MIGNSHIDPVWPWQWPEGYQEVRATFRSALDPIFKLAEGADDLVLRAIETSGSGASTCIDLPAWQLNVQFELAPYEIRTFRVPRDPRVPVTVTDLLERPLGKGQRVEAPTAA